MPAKSEAAKPWSVAFYTDSRGDSPVLEYIKKGEKAPLKEIRIAEKRMREFLGNEMRKLVSFEEWEAERMQDPEFVAAAEEFEPAYQIARLRVLRGLTQEQLAAEIGTAQPNIARLESGAKDPSVSSLRKIAAALDADLVICLVPHEQARAQPCQ